MRLVGAAFVWLAYLALAPLVILLALVVIVTRPPHVEGP